MTTINVTTGFEESFKHAPDVTATVPGRVNLIGEHVDYNGGMVLPAAIKQSVQVALSARSDDVLQIGSERFEVIERVLDQAANDHWSDYAAGALIRARDLGWLKSGANVYIHSDVPDGAGVSSSAALVTAVLMAAAAHAGITPDKKQVALDAKAVENDFIGMPCGIMDQMAVALASPGEALLLNCDTLDTRLIPIPEGWTFLTIHSGIRRALNDGRYAARFEECSEAGVALDIEHLCHLSPDAKIRLPSLPSNLQARTAHVVSEHQRVLQASDAMLANDISAFGRLMNESHTSYAQDFEASHPAIDQLVDTAREVGAVGARLTGGGFGGCIVVLVPAGGADSCWQALAERHPDAWLVST